MSLATDTTGIEQYTLTLTATDNGETQQLSGTTNIIIRVLNCTDRNNYFSMPFNYLEISEGERVFSSPSVASNIPVSVVGSPLASTFSPDYVNNPFELISVVNVSPPITNKCFYIFIAIYSSSS